MVKGRESMKASILLFGTVLTLNVLAGENSFYLDNIKWGMDEAQVKVADAGRRFVSFNTNRIQYDTEINGLKFTVGYEFKANGLRRVFYGLNNWFANSEKYYATYQTLKDDLILKYGWPVSDKENWKNGLYRNENPGLALVLGHLDYQCKWKTGDSEIWLFCGTDNGQFKTVITYDGRSAG